MPVSVQASTSQTLTNTTPKHNSPTYGHQYAVSRYKIMRTSFRSFPYNRKLSSSHDGDARETPLT